MMPTMARKVNRKKPRKPTAKAIRRLLNNPKSPKGTPKNFPSVLAWAPWCRFCCCVCMIASEWGGVHTLHSARILGTGKVPIFPLFCGGRYILTLGADTNALVEWGACPREYESCLHTPGQQSIPPLSLIVME